jgi:hypothetical protein
MLDWGWPFDICICMLFMSDLQAYGCINHNSQGILFGWLVLKLEGLSIENNTRLMFWLKIDDYEIQWFCEMFLRYSNKLFITRLLSLWSWLIKSQMCHFEPCCIFLFSDLELKPVGILEVKLVQAKELTNKDIIGKSDPYALLYIRPLRNRTKKSKTIVS